MPAIRDVMPLFELYQPESLADTLRLLDRFGARAWVLAGGLDTFDWLKDRAKRTEAVIDLSNVSELSGIKDVDGGLEIGATTTLTEIVAPSARAGTIRAPARGRGARGLAADPQPGHDRRQRVAGHALLVLPERLALLPRRRQHLLCRHADGAQPRARHSPRRSLRGGESVGHGAGPGRARRQDGDSSPGRRARHRCRGLFRRARRTTSRT